MAERDIDVINKLGLHARASAKLVQEASHHKARITIAARGREVDAKSIMGVMLLAVGCGGRVRVRCEGEGADDALEAIAGLFARRFDEGQ